MALDYATSRVAKTAYFLLFAGLQGLNLAGARPRAFALFLP